MKTPQIPYPKLSSALGITNEVWLKREDLHHYGSHKGRSIPSMIQEYRKQGVTNFVISSSGNAAKAAILAVQKFNQSIKDSPLSLTVLIGKKISPDKLQSIKKILDTKYQIPDTITLTQCARPKQAAFQMEKSGKAKWLRQSTDNLALTGYYELALELGKIPNLSAVFIPTSSGTTAQGLYDGFQKLGLNPEIHIIQTDACHPMVTEIKNQNNTINNTAGTKTENRSFANAIVDKTALRKQKVLEVLKNSHGTSWIASNEDIMQAQKIIKEITGIGISGNSALSVVGLRKAIINEWKWVGAVVCLVTGR